MQPKTYRLRQNGTQIVQIGKLLNDNRLLSSQRSIMVEFDRFNELEAQCRLNTRRCYAQTLHKLALTVKKPFQEMTKTDIQNYISKLRVVHKESVVELHKAHLRRFMHACMGA